jgi:hypothetical protein
MWNILRCTEQLVYNYFTVGLIRGFTCNYSGPPLERPLNLPAKVSSEKEWPLKRRISISGSWLDVAKFVQMSMLLKKIFKCKMLTFAENH